MEGIEPSPRVSKTRMRIPLHYTLLLKLVGTDRIELSPQVPKTWMRNTITPCPDLKLVRQARVELALPWLRVKCFNQFSYWRIYEFGGMERTRTVIVLLDKQIPHLSDTMPCKVWQRVSDLNRCFLEWESSGLNRTCPTRRICWKVLGGLTGFEPATVTFTVWCSAMLELQPT